MTEFHERPTATEGQPRPALSEATPSTRPTITGESERVPCQRIDELRAPPVVGQRYLVPTVLYPWRGVRKAWPVMGPRHEDGEHIGFHDLHYHIDIRFLCDSDADRISRKVSGLAWDAASLAAYYPLSSRGEDAHPAPVWRSRICHRADNAYPIHHLRTIKGLARLRDAYAGRRCGRGAGGRLICPHKGFVLDSLVPDERGRVVCPLHGLVIDVQAGAVVERAAMPEVRR